MNTHNTSKVPHTQYQEFLIHLADFFLYVYVYKCSVQGLNGLVIRNVNLSRWSAPYIYIYILYMCRTFISQEEHGSFYGLDLRKSSCWINMQWRSLHWDEEKDCRFKVEREELDTYTACMVNSCQGKVAEVISWTKLFNASKMLYIGCDINF